MRLRNALCLSLALGCVCLAQIATAAVVTQTGNVADRFGDFVIGYEVEVGGSDVTIDALGVYDKDGDGLTQSHDVGIFELNIPQTAWVLLDSTTVGPTSTILQDGFRYEKLGSEITMLANRRYRINSVFFSTGDAFIDTGFGSPAIAVTPGFAFNTPDPNIFTVGTTLGQGAAFGSGTPGRWVGGNATFIGVPEPSTLVLACFGLVAGALFRRRRR